MVERLSVSLSGALMAALSGAVLGGGRSLMYDDEASSSKTARKACGGALLVVGLYLFAPAGLRREWLD
jgi:hypothetical protein